MTANELNNKYFEWMCRLVCNNGYYRGRCYKKLLNFLHNTDFSIVIGLDENRAEDGIDLRYRFGYEEAYDRPAIASYLDNRPCSVFEMMVALAVRCEERIMQDPDIGNRVSQWFFGMIYNLGLRFMDDPNFDVKKTEIIIQRFLNRNYERDGKGGLFRVKNCEYDMRSIEIWYQMNWYLDEIA